MGSKEDLTITCSSSSTLCTTTVTTTTTTGILAAPQLNVQQFSSSTPCLTSPGLFNQQFNLTLPINSNLALASQNALNQHQSNPALSTSSNSGGGASNNWQIVRSSKRKKPYDTSIKIKMKKAEQPANPVTISPSVYQPIAVNEDDQDDEEMNEQNDESNPSQPTATLPPPPPPIFVHDVIDFQRMKAEISTVIPETDFITKTLANNTIKINPKTSDAYRTLVRHMRANNVIFHTYQVKQERAYRVVIRHIHYSIPVEDIKTDIENSGFKVRNIMNITNRATKTPLNLFFVDLEPANNNKEIFDLKYILNMKIVVEPPKKSVDIVQCTRCQMYEHTKSYCTRPFSCVKCGRGHSSTICTKSKDLPAKCVLCEGPHPANYKGCTVYKELQKMRQNNQTRQQTRPSNNQNTEQTHSTNKQPSQQFSSHQFPPIGSPYGNNNTRADSTTPNNNRNNYSNQTRLYANVVNHNQSQESSNANEKTSLNTFLQEFKSMFSQLMSQNTMIINMLQTVISSLVQKK